MGESGGNLSNPPPLVGGLRTQGWVGGKRPTKPPPKASNGSGEGGDVGYRKWDYRGGGGQTAQQPEEKESIGSHAAGVCVGNSPVARERLLVSIGAVKELRWLRWSVAISREQ